MTIPHPDGFPTELVVLRERLARLEQEASEHRRTEAAY